LSTPSASASSVARSAARSAETAPSGTGYAGIRAGGTARFTATTPIPAIAAAAPAVMSFFITIA
jgi:hypothetical protein